MVNSYELDKAEHDRRYAKIAAKYLACEAQENPRAIIIGGQPGSGKGQLTQQAAREMAKEGGFVLVDVDTLRDRHPQNRELMSENDREAANLTHSDASKWAKRLTNDAIEGRRNIIIDQTSKSPDSLVARTTQLREAGYQVEFRVMAVNAEISEQRIHTRYENQKALDGAGRFVPKEVHDAAYVGLPETLSAVERGKTVDVLKVHNKDQKVIDENTLQNGEWKKPPQARAALESERNRPLTLQEHKEQVAAYTKLAEMLEKRGAQPAEREAIEAQRLKATHKLAAETFRQVPPTEALKSHPELAGAYAAVAAVTAKAKEDGLTADQRQIVNAQSRHNVAAAVEQGKTPQVQVRETVQVKQEQTKPPTEKETTR